MQDLEVGIPSAYTEQNVEDIAQFYNSIVRDRLSHVKKLDFNCTLGELKLINAVFAPQVFVPDASKQVRSHHIPAVGLTLAQEYINHKKNGRYINIGDNFKNLDLKAHNCFKITGRDEARILEALRCSYVKDEVKEVLRLLLAGKDSPIACSKGAENCSYQADLIFMNNVYDISQEKMAKIMQKHNTSIVYIIMMLPPQVQADYPDYNEKFGYTITKLLKPEFRHKVSEALYGHLRNYNYVMSFNCGSWSYEHDAVDWRNWCINPAVNGEFFSVAFERIKTFGPMTVIRASKLHRAERITQMTPSVYTDYVEMYDISKFSSKILTMCTSYHPTQMDVLNRKHVVIKQFIQKNCRKIFLPKELHTKVLQHAMVREDVNFRRQMTGTMLKSLTTRITVTNREIQKGYNLDAETFHIACINMYVEACIYRQIETKVIGSLIDFVKGENDDVIKRIVATFKVFADELRSLFGQSQEYAFFTKPTKNLIEVIKSKAVEMHVRTVNLKDHFGDTEAKIYQEWEGYTSQGNCAQETVSLLKYGTKKFSSMCCQDDLYYIPDQKYVISGSHVKPILNSKDFCLHSIARNQTSPLILMSETDNLLALSFDFINSRPSRPEAKINLSKLYDVAFSSKRFYQNYKFMLDLDQKIVHVSDEDGCYAKNAICPSDMYNPIFQMCVVNNVNVLDSFSVNCVDCLNVGKHFIICNDLKASLDNNQLCEAEFQHITNLYKNGKKFIYRLSKFRSNLVYCPRQLFNVQYYIALNLNFFSIGNNDFVTNYAVDSKDKNLVFNLQKQLDLFNDYQKSAKVNWKDHILTLKEPTETADEFNVEETIEDVINGFNRINLDNKYYCRKYKDSNQSNLVDKKVSKRKDMQILDKVRRVELDEINVPESPENFYDVKSTEELMDLLGPDMFSTAKDKMFCIKYIDDKPRAYKFKYEEVGLDLLNGVQKDHVIIFDKNTKSTKVNLNLDNQIVLRDSNNMKDYAQELIDSIHINGYTYIVPKGLGSSSGFRWFDILYIVTCAAKSCGAKIKILNTDCDACSDLSVHNSVKPQAVGNEIVTPVEPLPQVKFGEVKVSIEKDQVEIILKALVTELSQDLKGKFGEINAKAIDMINKIEIGPINKFIKGITGVPGSGKSSTVKKLLDRKKVIIITPFKELSQDYKNDGFVAYTFIKAMTLDLSDKIVLLDEVFAMSPGVFLYYLIVVKELLIIGDPFQMPNVDKDDKIYKGLVTSQLFDFKSFPKLNVSFTVPLDICKILNEHYGYVDMKTNSKVINSIQVHGYSTGFKEEFYCFTTNVEKLNKLAVCVAKIQGKRTKETHLIIECSAKALIDSIPAQMVVALSRHSEKIHLYPQSPELITYYKLWPTFNKVHSCILSGPLDRENDGRFFRYDEIRIATDLKSNGTSKMEKQRKLIAERTGQLTEPFKMEVTYEGTRRIANVQLPEEAIVNMSAHGYYPMDASLPMEEVEELEIIRENIIVNTRNPSPEEVNRIMNHISYTEGTHSDIHGLQVTEFPEVNAIIDDPSMLIEDKLREGKRLQGDVRGRYCFAFDQNQTFHTGASRYGSKAPEVSNRKAKEFARRMVSGLMEHVNEIKPITFEDIQLCLAEQITRIKTKNEVRQMSLYDGDILDSCEKVSGFLKKQVKADLKIESWLRLDEHLEIKAGQGISAQPKAINIIVGATIKAMEKNLKASFKPYVKFGYGISPEDLDDWLKNIDFSNCKGIAADIDNMDKRRGKETDFYMDIIWKMQGANVALKKIMDALNIDWPLFLKFLIIFVHRCFQSGRQDTLYSNTLVALGWFFAFYVLIKPRAVLAQGDDVGALAEDVVLRVKGEYCDFMKIELTDTPTFVGYIMANGLKLDVPRLVCKLVNRTFTSDKDLQEYKVAVKDWLSIIRNQEEYNENNLIVALHYGITDEEANYLLDFLYSFANTDFVSDFKSKCLNYFNLAKFTLPTKEVIKNLTTYRRTI
ncbi:hypothetical protein [Wuhan arthropod virus 1]|uniref:hypothetical protein n=1 Tax=Wuhan arthropod virus 1 TaxID=1923690 RepID=UPI00090A28B5|nr:hypothetical protein [Wuhan arthropod virus 1]APG77754.1 hypothetical protein [Wuhan arthropod virus 1]